GQGGEFAKGSVPQQDVALLESFPEAMEQTQVVVMQVAEHDVEHRPATQGEEPHELKDGKAAALLLNGGLGAAFLVFPGLGKLCGRGIGHFDWTAIELATGAGAAVSGLGGGAEGFCQAVARQALPGLDIGG